MKRAPFLLVFIVLLTACGKPTTPEEQVLLSAVSRIEIAIGYERHCIGAGEKKPAASANVLRNMEEVAHMLAQELVKQMPGDPTDDEKLAYAQKRLDPYVASVRKRIDEGLEKEGCESGLGQEAKALYNFFSTVSPEEFHPALVEELKKISGDADAPAPVTDPEPPASGPMSMPANQD